MFILLDFPANSKGLTERERKIAIFRLRDSNVTTWAEDNAPIGMRLLFMLALSDWRTWGFILGYMVITHPAISYTGLVDSSRLS